MATRRQNPSALDDKEHWYEKPLNRWIAITTIGSFVFGIGFFIGDYKKDVEYQMSLMKKEQECNQAIQQEKEKFSEYKRNAENKQLENLSKTVDELTKRIGGHHEK